MHGYMKNMMRTLTVLTKKTRKPSREFARCTMRYVRMHYWCSNTKGKKWVQMPFRDLSKRNVVRRKQNDLPPMSVFKNSRIFT